MDDDELDLRPEAYASASHGEVSVGDIYESVVLPDPTVADVFETDDLPGRLLLTARVVYVLVVAVSNGHAVVVPITTADVAGDAEQFAAVAAAGATARSWMRLPPIDDGWDEDAVALLFMPQTLPSAALAGRQLQGMQPAGRELVRARFVRAMAGDGGA